MNMNTSQSLEQKQQYLRDHIATEEYEDFYIFCEKVIQDTDINSWNMSQVQQNVKKFNNYKLNKHTSPTVPKYSYNQYQSRQGNNKNDPNQNQQSQISQCASSRVVKTSAIELLDQVLQQQSYTSTKTQPKASVNSANRASVVQKPNANFATNDFTNNNNNVKNNSAISFEQFEFWTSSMPASNSKISNEIRNKSTSQYRTNKAPPIIIGGSPQVPSKNTYNININQQYYNVGQDHNKPRHQTQSQLKTDDFDIFNSQFLGAGTNAPNKTSPYLKKQNTDGPFDGSRNTLGAIRLKQVRDIKDNTHTHQRGASVNIDKNKDYYGQAHQLSFDETITCHRSIIRDKLSDRTLNVYFDKHQIIERKFLAADYAMYSIKVVPMGIQIKRNYQDFSKLRTTLSKVFPGIHLPYLQETSWLSGTNIDFINNQKKMLQFFTRDLIRNKEIRNSVMLQDFLTLKDHKTIKRKFEKYQQIQQSKGLEDLCLMEGKVRVTLNPEQKRYIQNFQIFVKKMNDLYERHEKLSQTLIEQFNQLMKTYKLLINLMEETEKQVKQFNVKVTTNTIKHLTSGIKIMRDTYKQQLSNIKFDYDIQVRKVLPFIKYERKNFGEINKLIQVEKKLKKVYDKRILSEKISLNQYYNSESTKGTKNGIFQQSSSLIVLKHQAGFLGYQIRTQGQRIFDELALKTAIRWKTLGQSYLNKLTDSIDYWKAVSKIQRDKFNTQLTF